MIRKIVCISLALLLCLPLLFGCEQPRRKEGLSVVCTVFPLYDWTRNILGDDVEAELFWLTEAGADLHSFQASAEDMIRVASADLVIFAGGPSDDWLRKALENKTEGLVLELSSLEGMELCAVSDESGHSHEDGHDHVIDEHLWLSLHNAAVATEAIVAALSELSSEHAAELSANGAAYLEKLTALDRDYKETVSSVENPRMIVADRFPFVYLAEAYGVEYCAAFSGCTTDVDADLSVVIRLAEHLKEWELGGLVITERSDGALAESVIRAAEVEKCRILKMNSMQSVRRSDAEGGMTYLSVMEENLQQLALAIQGD